tara:strand:+ start:411 stop:1010 length:600 start_codon:yes stop_codon:yes gene_type:complete
MLKKIALIILIYIFIHNKAFSNINRDRILNYLESFSSLSSEFIQINNNGDILSGKIFVSRPGKFRIEYEQIPLVLISDSKRLASVNKDLKSINFHSTNKNPLSILLFKKLDMKEVKILNLVEKENTLLVEISSDNFEDKGFVEILFETKPLKMKKWTVFKTDQTKTEVFFDNLFLNKSLPSRLFDIELEDPRKIPFQIY